MHLITPPDVGLVSLAELKSHLRVDYSEDDELIAGLEAAAVGYLDGWRGVLGRPLGLQVWRQEFSDWGCLRLALPDVSAVAVTYLDAAGVEQVATSAELINTALGPLVEAEGPAADRLFVNMTCAMPTHLLVVAKVIVKMMVSHWYQNREAVSAVSLADVPLGANALIEQLRWRNT